LNKEILNWQYFLQTVEKLFRISYYLFFQTGLSIKKDYEKHRGFDYFTRRNHHQENLLDPWKQGND